MADEEDLLNRPSTSIFNSMTIGQRKSITNCAFCGDTCSESGRSLQPCLFCGVVAYCSSEHQKFDWKKHKMICKAIQARGMNNPNPIIENGSVTPAVASSAPTSKCFESDDHPRFNILSTKNENEHKPEVASFSGFGSAFRPYRNIGGNSMSSGSVSSIATSNEASLEHLSSTSLSKIDQFPLDLPGKQVPIKVLTARNISVPTTPSTSKKEIIVQTDDPDIQIIESKSHVRTRKRPTPSNSAELKPQNFKDHNKNVVYSTTLQEHQRHLQNRGLALNIHQAMVLRLRYISEHVIRSLNEFGWAVVDNFLGSEHYKYTAMEIERLYRRGLFSAGQLMEGKNKDEFHIKDIRSDQIYWYDGVDKRAGDAATVRLLISMIDSVIQHFKNRIDHDIGGRSRAMLAIYPGSGTRYVKHVDNPVKDGRCITTIYYCNENWDMAKDGGTLRLYPETSMTPMDIDPRADRVVFFWSDRRNPHEVMPVYRHRFAITIWYMDKMERDKALARDGKENPATAESMVKGVKKVEPVSTEQEIGLSAHSRINTSTHELSNLDLRLFPSTSSDPILTRRVAEEETVEREVHDSSSVPGNHPESTDSGVSFSRSHNSLMERCNSLQSISDAFKSERGDRRTSTGSDTDLDESDLPAPPRDNPEYNI